MYVVGRLKNGQIKAAKCHMYTPPPVQGRGTSNELRLAAGAGRRAAAEGYNGFETHIVRDQWQSSAVRGARRRAATATLYAALLADRSLCACGQTGTCAPLPAPDTAAAASP